MSPGPLSRVRPSAKSSPLSLRRALIASLLVGICSVVGSARAERPSELPHCASHPACETIFLQGRRQSEKGNASEALRLYKAAYEVRADPLILYSIGRVLHKQGQAREAIAYYQRFLDAPLDRPELKSKAQEYLTELRRIAPPPDVPLPPPAPAVAAAPQAVPVYKRGWFWGVLGGSLVAVGLGVGLGVGLSQRASGGVNIYEPMFR